jgi:hypothetical protein
MFSIHGAASLAIGSLGWHRLRERPAASRRRRRGSRPHTVAGITFRSR